MGNKRKDWPFSVESDATTKGISDFNTVKLELLFKLV